MPATYAELAEEYRAIAIIDFDQFDRDCRTMALANQSREATYAARSFRPYVVGLASGAYERVVQ
jgi:hypothetical protein